MSAALPRLRDYFNDPILAALFTGDPDGMLVVVSADGARYLDAGDSATTLEQWTKAERGRPARIRRGGASRCRALSPPLPRTIRQLNPGTFELSGDRPTIGSGCFVAAPVSQQIAPADYRLFQD